MKKYVKVLLIVFAVVFSLLSLSACADAGAPDHDVSDPRYSVSASSLESKLEDFLSACENRTTYTDGERRAAEYLNEQLVGYGYDDVGIREFSVSESAEIDGVTQEKRVNSRNVVAVYSSGDGDARKNVILCAYYDNRYSQPFSGAVGGFGASAALSNGTGVATLLEIAEYLQSEKPALDFDVTIAFLGASALSDIGAQRLYNDMTSKQREATVLVVELQRVGAEHIYAFSDARKTERETFFDGISADNGLDIYKVTQKSPVITGMSALNGVPYFQWAHSGVFPVFFNAGIPTLNVVGADWETNNLTDNDTVSFTENDTLKNLKDSNPEYADSMATAATLVIEAMKNDGFLTAMQYDVDNFPNTDVLEKEWIWYVVVLGVLAVAIVAMYIVFGRLTKKYPMTVPQPKKMKMAVFGMDYEDKNSDNIYIDIQTVGRGEEIFPGVPNNEPAAKTPFDDIFPPFVAPTASTPAKKDEPPVSEPEKDPPVDEAAKQASTEGEHAEEPTENAQAEEPIAEKRENADGVEAASSAESKKPKAQTKKSTAQKQGDAAQNRSGASTARKPSAQTKRKTVSAGKSTHKSSGEAENKDEPKESE
ncbi:MAG: M28 family peptidase [Roseburia sp.]|nr:M28 family peptidase [Roseburia sp.]